MSEAEAPTTVSDVVSSEAVETPTEVQAESVERPQWLPEKFESPEALAESYSSLEAKLGKGETELRENIIKELEEQAYAERPASAGEYQMPEEIPDDFVVDNELLDWWSNHCYENGFNQEEFASGLEVWQQAIGGTQPDIPAETAKLGDNANARIEAVSLWSQKFFPPEYEQSIMRLGETAEGIMALELMMQSLSTTQMTDQASTPSTVSQTELEEMMRDERYWKAGKRDPNYVKQVQEGYNRIYGNTK